MLRRLKSHTQQLSPETALEQGVLVQKHLATITLPEQITISFIKEEEDGISYQAIGKVDSFKGLGTLNELSILELFCRNQRGCCYTRGSSYCRRRSKNKGKSF